MNLEGMVLGEVRLLLTNLTHSHRKEGDGDWLRGVAGSPLIKMGMGKPLRKWIVMIVSWLW